MFDAMYFSSIMLSRGLTNSKCFFSFFPTSVSKLLLVSNGSAIFRNSRPKVFLGKSVLNICSKFTGEHPCRNVISIKSLCNFIEAAIRHECYPVNLLHIFTWSFSKNTFGRLLLNVCKYSTYFWIKVLCYLQREKIWVVVLQN